jgi:hypothetical protein
LAGIVRGRKSTSNVLIQAFALFCGYEIDNGDTAKDAVTAALERMNRTP